MNGSGAPSFRRRKYIIDKSYQFKFIGVVLLSIIMVYLLCNLLVLSVLSTVMDQFFKVPGAAALYPQLLWRVFGGVWLWLVVILAIGFVLSVVVSHQIAGPLYRLKMVAQEIAAGDFSRRVKFRKRDQLQDVAVAINAILDKMGEVIREDRALLAEARELLHRLDRVAGEGGIDKKDYKALRETLQHLLRRMETHLATEIKRAASARR